VLAYGLGMAAMLTAAGLLLVSLRDRFGPRLARFRRLADFTPRGTAALVMLIVPAALGLAACDTGRSTSTKVIGTPSSRYPC
jgi:cytochrome c biogenesis protein CcdA